MCYSSCFILFWRTKYNTLLYLSLVIGTKRLSRLLCPKGYFTLSNWHTLLINKISNFYTSQLNLVSSLVRMSIPSCEFGKNRTQQLPLWYSSYQPNFLKHSPFTRRHRVLGFAWIDQKYLIPKDLLYLATSCS